jgi:hypothetical protein
MQSRRWERSTLRKFRCTMARVQGPIFPRIMINNRKRPQSGNRYGSRVSPCPFESLIQKTPLSRAKTLTAFKLSNGNRPPGEEWPVSIYAPWICRPYLQKPKARTQRSLRPASFLFKIFLRSKLGASGDRVKGFSADNQPRTDTPENDRTASPRTGCPKNRAGSNRLRTRRFST